VIEPDVLLMPSLAVTASETVQMRAETVTVMVLTHSVPVMLSTRPYDVILVIVVVLP